jgi:exonuclease SbcC
MRIKSIILNNIRSYKEETIYFPEGSVLLSGDIGAGKSTILHAIEFALFGLRRKHLTGSALLRKGAKQGDVELNFELGSKDIVIKRTLKRSADKVEQSSGYIVINNVKQELTAVELKAKVLEMLGYPMELLTKSKNLIYTYTVYTPQEEMKEILTEEADIRLDVLRKVFGFNRYKVVRENCGIALKEMRSRIKILESMTADLVEKKRDEAKMNEQAILLKEQSAKIEISLNQTKEDIDKRIGELRVLEQQREIVQDLRRSLAGCDARYEEKQKNILSTQKQAKTTEEEILLIQKKNEELQLIKPIVEQQNVEKELSEKEAKIYEAINEENAIRSKLQYFENIIKMSESEIAELSKQIGLIKEKQHRYDAILAELQDKELAESEKKEHEDKLSAMNENIQELNLMKKTSHESIEKIANLSNCPMCLQQVSHEHKEQITKTETDKIFKWNDELNKLFAEKRILEFGLSKMNEKLESLKKKEKENEKLKMEIELYEDSPRRLAEKTKAVIEHVAQKKEYEDRLKNMQKSDIIGMKKYVDTLKEQLKMWQRYYFALKDKEQYQKRIDSLILTKTRQADLEMELQKELHSIGTLKKEISEKIEVFKELEMKLKFTKDDLDALAKTEKGLLAAYASQSKEIYGVDVQLRLLKTDIEKKEKDRTELNRLSQTQNWIEKSFIPLTVSIERQIMLHVHRLFNELFKKWLGMLIEDELITVKLNQDFTPVIEQNGFDTDYEHLSGGEKTSIALAYRLALNKTINDLYRGIGTNDLLILDEPTDGFSREHLDKLREVFDELNMKQLIIVSHENKIESFVENVIHITKNEHISGVYG